jgi:23S rRNA (guanosine2251-2'-O)-methyltransferase
MRIITGFHSIEEELRAIAAADKSNIAAKIEGLRLVYAKPGPRVKKILASVTTLGIPSSEADMGAIDKMVMPLPPTARDHRGIVLVMENEEQAAPLRMDDIIKELALRDKALVLILDSITDPQNVGAIIRSADQFGVDLVVLPEHRGATDFEVISRTSAGAASWVNIVLVSNLVRAVEQLKEAGFWIYGADAGGTAINKTQTADKTALVMGSEGTGMARLLKNKCDSIVSIPTTGKLDSLNVSVAAGVLLYEIRRSKL